MDLDISVAIYWNKAGYEVNLICRLNISIAQLVKHK